MEIQRYGKNETGRDFACSDLHGEHAKFYEALERVRFDPSKDRVFSAGDMCDRGKDSERCIRLLEKPWFKSLKGNHEEMLLLGAGTPLGQRYHSTHGGAWFYTLKKEKRQRLVDLVTPLPYAFEIETNAGLIGMVHADVCVPWTVIREALDGTTPEHTDACKTSVAWADSRFKKKDTSVCEGIHHVYVGHIPMKSMLTLGNVTYIDGGACYSESRVVNLVQIS